MTHKIIEECMIAANVEAAKRFAGRALPSLFRVHERPAAERIEELALFLQTFGIKLPPPSKLTPRDFGRVMQRFSGQARGRAHRRRCAAVDEQGRLSAEERRAFRARAGDAYAHFTSPIRRYPDLLVHRAIKWLLKKHRSPKGYGYSAEEMEQLGERCSRAERRADEAVWEVEEQLKCLFMQIADR